jgi:hypothetical protein
MAAHKGIEGNEKVDRLAKATIEGGILEEHATTPHHFTNPPYPPDPLGTSIPSLTRSKLYQQRYARQTKKMALRVNGQTLRTRLDEVWKVMRSLQPQDIQGIGAYT